MNFNLPYIRKDIQKFFIDTIEIYNVTTTYDRYGKPTETETLATTVKGQITDVTGSEAQIISALIDIGNANIETARINLPYDTAVSVNQRIKTVDNKEWNIVFVNTSQTFTAVTYILIYRKVVS